MIFQEINAARQTLDWLHKRFIKNDPEAAEKVMEMQSTLFGLQSALLERLEEFRKLSADFDILKKQLDHRGKLVRRNGYYEFADPVDGYGNGPFCLHCTDIQGRPVSVNVHQNGYFLCAGCQTGGWLEGCEPPPPSRQNYNPHGWMDRE